MSGFEDRERYIESDARKYLMEVSNMIRHLLDNGDGTFSIMGHIVCEHCDYCDSQGDSRGEYDIVAVPAKPDPYELQNEMWAEFEREESAREELNKLMQQEYATSK